jgi:hypothetical protein
VSRDAATLEAVQRWMQDALIRPDEEAGEMADRLLAPSTRLTAAAGLAIYQRGYFLRIASCMREQFPALCHALGEALFDDFVGEYIRECPPESYTLYDLGRRFPAYLAENRPDRDLTERESWIDFMIDLADFERQVFAMFDAPGHEGKTFADVTTPDDRLRLQPCFALGAYRFAVATYYHAVRQEQPVARPPAEPQYVALVRTDYVTRTIPLSATEHRFLQAMAEGSDADLAIAAVARHFGLAPDAVRENWTRNARSRWIDCGFFVASGDAS